MFARIALLLAVLCFAGAASADQNDPRLDALFGALQKAKSETDARFLEAQIWSIWHETDSPTAQLMLQRGTAALGTQNFSGALIAFNTLVEVKPDFAEGWNKRATLFYLMGRYEDSIADVEKTLDLEPRHFGALAGLGMIYEAMEEEDKALEAFRRALEVSPFIEHAKNEVERLTRKLKGDRI